jgi:hypothetical protein
VTSLPTVSFPSGNLGFYSESSISVPVTLSQSISRTVQVEFTTFSTPGPGVGNFEDWWIGDAGAFGPSSGTVTFAPGQTTAAILLNVYDPNAEGCPVTVSECYPALGLTLSSPMNALLGSESVTYLAYGLDDD